MASMWRRAMLYLGLGPDEEYDDYDLDDSVPSRAAQGAHRPARSAPEPTRSPVQTVQPVPSVAAEPEPPSGSVRTLPAEPSSRPSVVRPLPSTATAKPHAVTPVSFNEAKEVADRYKGNQPVIVNLQSVDRDLSRRLIDFASGLCYGLGGQMEKVANQVYLLTPSNVEVSAEERRRLEERGFDDA